MGCVGCMDPKKREGQASKRGQKDQAQSPEYRVHESDAKQKENYRQEDKKQEPEVINVQPYKPEKQDKVEAYEEKNINKSEKNRAQEENYEKSGRNQYQQEEDVKARQPPVQEEEDKYKISQIPYTPSSQIKGKENQENQDRRQVEQRNNEHHLKPDARYDGNTLNPINEINEKSSSKVRSGKESDRSEKGSSFEGSNKQEPTEQYQRASKMNASGGQGFEWDEPPKRASKMHVSSRQNHEEYQGNRKMAESTAHPMIRGYKQEQGSKSMYNNNYYVGGSAYTPNNYNQDKIASNNQGQNSKYNNREDFTQSKGNTLNFSKSNQIYEENNPTYGDRSRANEEKNPSYDGSRRGQENNGYREEREENRLQESNSYRVNQQEPGHRQNSNKGANALMNFMDGSSKNRQDPQEPQDPLGPQEPQEVPYEQPYRVNEPANSRPPYDGQHEVFQKSSKMNESASNRYNQGQNGHNEYERNSRLNASKSSNRQNQGQGEFHDKNSRASGSRYNSRINEQFFEKSNKLDLSKSNQYFNDKVNESFEKGNRAGESRGYNYNDTSLGPSGLNYSKSNIQNSQAPHNKYSFERSKLDNSKAYAKSNNGSREQYRMEDTRTQGGLRQVNEAPLQASRQNASRISSQVEEMVYNTATYNYNNKPTHARSTMGDQKQRRQIFTSQVQNYSRPPIDSRTGKSYHDPNNRPEQRYQNPTNSAHNRSKLSNPGQSGVYDRSEVRPYKMEPVPEEEAGDTMGFGWGSKILKL